MRHVAFSMTVLAGPPQVRRSVSAGRRAGARDQLGRIPRDLWAALAEDEAARARYCGKVYWRGPGRCAFFVGALSSGGHGRFRAGTRRAVADRPASLVVPAHVYGFVLSRGLPQPDPVAGLLPLIRHRCDEPRCQAAGHLAAGSPAENTDDYLARRRDPYSPLNDRRGPRGRAVAIRNAILAALAEDASAGQIEAAIETVSAAGIPGASRCSSELEFPIPETTTIPSAARGC
jgi:hypothetical protein